MATVIVTAAQEVKRSLVSLQESRRPAASDRSRSAARLKLI